MTIGSHLAKAVHQRDETSARALLSSLLDKDDMRPLSSAISEALSELKDEDALVMESWFDAESNRVPLTQGRAAELVCLAMLTESNAVLPTPFDIADILISRVAPSALFMGWVDAPTMVALQPTDYRRLARHLGTAPNDKSPKLVPLPQSLSLVRSGCGHGPYRGMDGETLRFFMFAMTGKRASALNHDEAIQIPGFPGNTVLSVARPSFATARAVSELQTRALSVRLGWAEKTCGRPPIGHFNIDSQGLRLLLTSDGLNVIDDIHLSACGMDFNCVSNLVFSKCRGVVQCAHVCELPPAPAWTRSVH